jgi:hypothetical protein
MILKLDNSRIVAIIKADGTVTPFYGSEIGFTVWVLHNKLWGKIIVGNRPRSEQWWKSRQWQLIYDTPTIETTIDWKPGIYNPDGTPQEPPIPFEKETGLDRFPPELWLGILQRVMKSDA